jgi:Ras-related protein Rab-7A
MLKILILGDAAVGKTSILKQFVDREFTGQYKATIGSDFLSKQLDIDGHPVTLQIWDTAGQDRFQSLGSTFYRGAEVCVFVYDIAQSPSFGNIPKWLDAFSRQLGLSKGDSFPFLLLGNKSDLPNKVVQPSAAREYAEENGMIFHEVSAKTADGVHAAFEAVVRKALETIPRDAFTVTDSVLNEENMKSPAKADGQCGC